MRAGALQKKVEETVLDSYEAMYRLAYTYVRNEEDALDIVQESVYKAIKHSAYVKQEAHIKTWLWRIVMNTALDFIRKNQKEVAVETFYEHGKEDSYQDFDTIEALKVLDEKEKAVVVLRFFEDQKLGEIARILNENTNTVKTILYRSLKKLKLELTEGESQDMKDKRLEEMKQDYENIRIPEELHQRVEMGIRKAKEEKNMKKKSKVLAYTGRVVGGVAAAMLVITVMANSGATIAHAMARIPIIGAIAERVVTFREYESAENNMTANIKIPEVSVKNEDGTVNEETTQKINKSIEEYTNEIIAQYEADVEAAGEGEGHMDVELDYSVITDSDRLFSIRFDQLLVMASGTQMVKIYHIDKQTGEMINLAGLFKEGVDFAPPISENIKEQMKEQMAADEMISYWLDSDVPEWDFQSVTEDTTFYVNEAGKLMIVFDEYEVAPGYMGSVEFEIPTEVLQDIVQEGFLES